MSILIEAGDSEWKPICECLLAVAEFAKREGDYIWYRGRRTPWLHREVERLIAFLGVGDQFAWVEDHPTSSIAAVLRVADSPGVWTRQLEDVTR